MSLLMKLQCLCPGFECVTVFLPRERKLPASVSFVPSINWFGESTVGRYPMAKTCVCLTFFPGLFACTASEAELVGLLTCDFRKEGWLFKTGQRPSDGYKRHWFTLAGRKLMYHDEPLDTYPKGEIFLGHNLDGYRVRVGAPTGVKPEGVYNLSASSEQERDDWIAVIQKVLERPPTPQESSNELIRY